MRCELDEMLPLRSVMVTLEDLTKSYYKARANKRRSRDSVVFEIDYESELVRLMEDINSRSFVADGNYAFVVFSPKPREIFATRMRNRIVHHYLDWKMRPIYEMVLSDRSFNNREGMGLHKAIDTFRNDIKEMTEGYTKDAWLVHLDLKGYFPNADVEIALRQQLDLIERYYEGADKDDMKYMMESCMRADPARHCNIYVPLDRWDAIPDSKSLFHKPTGTGGAIGFLCWQNAMGLYINDVVKWLASHDFMRVMVFVDDIYMVTKDKDITLAMMPELRRRLAELKVSLNERKFYCQHYSKGIMCLGTMLKFDRAYVNNTTSKRAFKSLSDWKGKFLHGLDRQRLLCSLNTYCGIFKKRNNRKELLSFIGSGLKMFREKLVLNGKKNCFNLKKGRKTWSNSP